MMKRIVLCFVLVFVINSVAVAAPLLSDFPLGMTQKEAIAKGLVMQDEYGGILNVMFGGKEWPAALVFENEKLIYLILKGNGSEFISAAEDGLWLISWLIIYEATDNNFVFDAIKHAASGMSDEAIGEEYEKFLIIKNSQNYKNSNAIYVSVGVWSTIRLLRGETPVDKYPDAALCNISTDGNEVTLVFTTFGYMDKMSRQATPR
jgi:hypothetical protein